ncbi:unnamed protein product [Rotaria socialis]|uniref:VWFA domain-containing protein n=1 Tax=Rotaria socialis TaxID=392032 RepID=A0A817XNI2_9BILA|nr:unnamed protein product [Rotaria socialis]CAF4884850.1 unnamed protein product [Rotaria socialis]
MIDSSALLFDDLTTHAFIVDSSMDRDDDSYEKYGSDNSIHKKDAPTTNCTPYSIDNLRPSCALTKTINNNRCSVQPDIQSNPHLTQAHLSEITVLKSHADGFVHISIQPPIDESRSPCNICCVVDTSGSMSTEVDIRNDRNEQYDLSQLDLVKHAIKTIIYSLQNQDRLSIVSFSHSARIVFRLTKMDYQGKKHALAAIEKLSAHGETNLWDGLQTGIGILSKEQYSIGSISSLFLLTDGCPNVEPSGGHLKSLKRLKKKIGFTCAINTFGFGYKLNSKLLEDISILGNSGSYAFIPDGSFVGTVFVNAISTLLTTAATNVQLLLHDKFLQPTNYTQWYSRHITKKGTYFDLGSITYGQSKDLLISISPKFISTCKFKLTYNDVRNTQKILEFNLTNNVQQVNLDVITHHKFRLEFVNCVRTALEKMRDKRITLRTTNQRHRTAINHIETLQKKMRSCAIENDQFMNDLFTDLTGQVKQAVEKQEWFQKWGIHFLPSLARAHLLQFCNNFKDPGVQHYGKGQLFSKVRDEMDEIFCSLPAPKRTRNGASIDMRDFYDAAGGCFYGECTVGLMNGTTKFVKDIKPHDRTAPHGGMVVFVVKTKLKSRQAKMIMLENNLIITPWHPIRVHDQWIMPCSLVSSPELIYCETVYNFVLDRGHTVLVNDTECVTLGHHFKEDIVRHPYYGSQRIIDDLQRLDLEQNNTGFIEITQENLVRNVKTDLVKGLRSQQTLFH